jgi:hypothetical protein
MKTEVDSAGGLMPWLGSAIDLKSKLPKIATVNVICNKCDL